MRAPGLYRDEIDRYCPYKGLKLAEVFSDLDRSGFSGAKARPALEELTRRRLEFSAIIVPKLARFGRSSPARRRRVAGGHQLILAVGEQMA